MMTNPLKQAAEMANRIRISSVLSNLLWPLPYEIGGLIIISFAHNFLVEIFFIVIISVQILVILGTFLFTLLFGNEDDKNRLRNEDYAYNMKILGILGDSVHLIEYVKAVTSSGGINNPAATDPEKERKLTPPEEDTQKHLSP